VKKEGDVEKRDPGFYSHWVKKEDEVEKRDE
jgi:hypothetical protein